MRVTQYLESSGLPRSLDTNIPDHPTAIQVNGLRQERDKRDNAATQIQKHERRYQAALRFRLAREPSPKMPCPPGAVGFL